MEASKQEQVPYTLLESVRKLEVAREELARAARILVRRPHLKPGYRVVLLQVLADRLKDATQAAEAARTLQITYRVEADHAAALRVKNVFVGIIECVDGDEAGVALPVRIQASTEAEAHTKLQALVKDHLRLESLFPGMGIPEKRLPESCYLVGEDAPLI